MNATVTFVNVDGTDFLQFGDSADKSGMFKLGRRKCLVLAECLVGLGDLKTAHHIRTLWGVTPTPVAEPKPAPTPTPTPVPTVKPPVPVVPTVKPPVASAPTPATVPAPAPSVSMHNAKGKLLPRFRHAKASADATVTLQGTLYGRIEGRTYTWTVCAKLADHWRTYRGSMPISFCDSAPAPTPPAPAVTVAPAVKAPAPTVAPSRTVRAEMVGIVDGVQGIVTLYSDGTYEFVGVPASA